MAPIDEAVTELVLNHGFMPVLHSLRKLCVAQAEAKGQSELPNAAFYSEFWTFASQNLAAAELLIIEHVQENPPPAAQE
jgi:hypothetical protein